MTFGSSITRCGSLIYLVQNAADSTTDYQTAEGAGSGAKTDTINVPAGGLLIAAMSNYNGTAPTAMAGIDFDAMIGTVYAHDSSTTPEHVMTGGSRWYPNASSGGTVSMTTANNGAILSCSFAEA